MAKGWTGANIYGQPADQTAIDQLGYRADVLSKLNSRSDLDQMYLTGKGAFVQISSAIDVDGSSGPARDNILSNGISGEGGFQKKGLGDLNTFDPAYINYDSMGFRPMAGIDSAEIASKNTYGTHQEATINFKCWSLEQLNDLEKIYLRPGFTMLVEWGHTVYYDKTGALITSPQTVAGFFDGSGLIGQKAVLNTIKALREASGGNYEGMLGQITNFSWSYRLDGGYDCSVKVISLGVLTESLSAALSLGQTEEQAKKEAEEELTGLESLPEGFIGPRNKVDPEKSKTTLHRFLRCIKEALPPDTRSDTDQFNLNVLRKIGEKAPTIRQQFLQELKNRQFNVLYQPLEADEGTADYKELRYIRLRDFLILVNTLFLKSEGKPILRYNTDSTKALFFTFPQHQPLDPGICILPKSSGTFGFKHALRANIQDTPVFNSMMNIYVEVSFLLNQLNTVFYATTRAGQSIQTLVDNVLRELSRNLGGVNDFDATYDADQQEFYLIDRKLAPTPSAVPTIDVIGLRSTVRNLKLNSQIPSNLSNMMAVAARSGGFADDGLDYQNMAKWNAGLQDRYLVDKHRKSNENIESRVKQDQGLLNAAIERFNTVQRTNLIEATEVQNQFGPATYDPKAFNSLASSHRFAMQKLANDYNGTDKGTLGLIPLSLSITLEGIVGFKITQAFKLNEGILPPRYDGVSGFIIRGISHSISENRWETTLDAWMIIL